MHIDLDDAGIDRALREERSVAPSPQFAARVMRSVREEADATQALPFPWIRFGLGLALAGLVLLILLGSSAGSAPAWTVTPAVARTVEVVSVTLTGTFALVTWSLRLGRP